jgi:hypothetical protein
MRQMMRMEQQMMMVQMMMMMITPTRTENAASFTACSVDIVTLWVFFKCYNFMQARDVHNAAEWYSTASPLSASRPLAHPESRPPDLVVRVLTERWEPLMLQGFGYVPTHSAAP